MAPILRLALILECLFLLTLQQQYSAPQDSDDEATISIAIVGAGITGASAARHLLHPHKKINITIFESASHIGGRLQSHPYIGNHVAEKGAPHFSENDDCLVDTAKSLDLRMNMHVSGTTTVAVWDWNGNGNWSELLLGGQGLGCSVGVEKGTLQDLVKEGRRKSFPPVLMREIATRATEDFKSWTRRFQRYGILAPWILRRAVAGDLAKWKRFAQGSLYSNLDKELSRIGLSSRALGPTQEYVDVAETFAKSQIEPCTRASFSQNLDQLRGLGIAISSDPGRIISLWDGNSRLVHKMIEQSGAVVKTNSQVTQIKPGTHRRYRVKTTNDEKEELEFDTVVIAGVPENLSSMLSDILLPHEIPSPPQYTGVHVTHFATERLLHLPRSDRNEALVSASVVYFTNNPDPDQTFPNLFQASTSLASERTCDGEPECDEFTYHRVHRIVSNHPLSDPAIAKLVGVNLGKGETLELKGITRVERVAWPRAFPLYEKDRQIPGDIELAPGLLYLGGGEEVVGSLEMGCRMGRNAAGLIVTAGLKTESFREEL